MAPQQRGRGIQLDLPPLRSAADAVAALDVVRSALAAGDISETELKAVVGLIEQTIKAFDVVDYETRLKALEERIWQKQ